MKSFMMAVLLSGLMLHAQTRSKAAWYAMGASGGILTTDSLQFVQSPYAPGGRERPILTMFCGVSSVPVVEFRGHFQLADSEQAVVIDGETLTVSWSLSRDRESMSATKSDVQGLAYRMRHAKEMTVLFQTTGGPVQSASFSLQGLDALMNREGCE